MSYRVYGSGDNLLLLIHAFPMNNKMFDLCIDSISINNWRVLLPNLPGFGDAPLSEQKWTMYKYADYIKSILDSLSYNKLVLGGISMGGYIIMAFIEKYPDIADGYIFANTRDSDDPDGGDGRRSVVESIKQGNRMDFINNLLNRLVGKTTIESRPQVIQQVLEIISTTPDKAIIQSMLAMAERKNSRNIIKLIKTPTLLIAGEEDNLTGPDTMAEMCKFISDCKFVKIEKAGHFAVMETPDDFANAIVDFINNRF